MLQFTVLPADPSFYSFLFCKSAAITCKHAWRTLSKTDLFCHWINGFQSLREIPGGCLRETENKRVCQISGSKSGCGRIRNLRVVAYTMEFLKEY